MVSDSPGLVDFAIGLVNYVFNLPDGQVMFFWGIRTVESILQVKKVLGLAKMMSGLPENSSRQSAKKVVSDSPGLVDFAIGLVNYVFNLPDGQVMFFWGIRTVESILQVKKVLGLAKMMSGLVMLASACPNGKLYGKLNDFLCTLSRTPLHVTEFLQF